MFICIVGTRSSGKTTLEDFLVESKGFVRVQLLNEGSVNDFSTLRDYDNNTSTVKHLSFLSMENTPSPSPLLSHSYVGSKPLSFKSSDSLLDYVTGNWRGNFVTRDIRTRSILQKFVRRPFFMLINLDAPLLMRYQRSFSDYSLEDFVRTDDHLVFGPDKELAINSLTDLVNMHINNNFENIDTFHIHLNSLNLLDPVHLRPDWDTYFMTLASLASLRSNCMKRRVGAILVRDNRIVSTGYNGTPRNLMNCNEGGCPRCNRTSDFSGMNECLCLHAEENALLEAGRERVGAGAVLYCNTCPCLKCTIKIIQTGVKAVVYNLEYKVDAASARLFREASVELRQFDPKTRNHTLEHDQSIPQLGSHTLNI